MSLRRALMWAAIILPVLLAAAVVLLLNELRTLNVLYVQSCAQEGTFPGSNWICRQALYRFHPTPEEVREMNRTAGATWALSMMDDGEARLLLRHYIDAGVNVNAVDQQHPEVAWSPLHIAAAGSDPRGVRLLLEFGAKVDAKDAKGRTPLDLAQQQAQRFPEDPDYAEAAAILQAAMGKSSAR